MQVLTQSVVGGRLEERRRSDRGPAGSDGYTPMIKQIEAGVVRHLQEHDAKHQRKEKAREIGGMVYAPSYSLSNHNAVVGTICARVVAEEPDRFSLRDVAVIRTGGRWHDLGKTLQRYGFYRNPRRLTDSERERKTFHAGDGAVLLDRYIRIGFSGVTSSEWLFIQEALMIVAYHHEPDRVLDPRLRSLAVRAKCVDAFWSMQEDRPERPGLSAEVALGFLRKDIAEDKSFSTIRSEAEQVAKLLEQIYVSLPTQRQINEEVESRSG